MFIIRYYNNNDINELNILSKLNYYQRDYEANNTFLSIKVYNLALKIIN